MCVLKGFFCFETDLLRVYFCCRDGTVLTEKGFYENLKSSESWTAWSQISAWKALRKIGSFVPMPIGYFSGSEDDELRYIYMEQVKVCFAVILFCVESVRIWNYLVSHIFRQSVSVLRGKRL